MKSMGFAISNLGVDISTSEVEEFADICKPKYVCIIINISLKDEDLKKYINNIHTVFSGSTLMLSGFEVIKQKLRSSEALKIFNSINEIISYLKER